MPASERWVGCAAVARENDESLRGTAARAHGWVLIEHRGPWGREPWGPDGPLGRIGTELSRRCNAVGVRRQLVRESHSRREPTETRQVFLAHSGRRGPWLEKYTVDTVEQILELPLEAAAAGTPPGIGARVDQRLYLVCTHGKKDPCCAVLGRPVAAALDRPSGRVWESTHLGGDRYAAGMVALPDGSYYGNLEPTNAQAVVDDHDRGHLTLRHYRGRCTDETVAQIAEHAVRTEYGLTGIDDVHPSDVTSSDVTSSGVASDVVVVTTSGTVQVHVAPDPEPPRRTTCRSEDVARPDHGMTTIRSVPTAGRA
ncbi:sucrase ferredoxin [Rhodococcus sp. IEGM 1354]|uniref:sucrase ferredoxin n=1 Tax=Rhodococcus sp. IEGM 1354 TaxID=3047088 RepID=UPI0024B640A5|nr:sucrase ferredoxin [Rhodococcus sp. IEGM 1354]MDI9928790.1 sucrase ferredoxin [Rhodococcus sp. IEGM 1354]